MWLTKYQIATLLRDKDKFTAATKVALNKEKNNLGVSRKIQIPKE